MANCLERSDSQMIAGEEFFSLRNKNNLINNDDLCISSIEESSLCSKQCGNTSDSQSETNSLPALKTPEDLELSSELIIINKDYCLDEVSSKCANERDFLNEEVVSVKEINTNETSDINSNDSKLTKNSEISSLNQPISDFNINEISVVSSDQKQSDIILVNFNDEISEEVEVKVPYCSNMSDSDREVSTQDVVLCENSEDIDLISNDEVAEKNLSECLECDVSVDETYTPIYETKEDETCEGIEVKEESVHINSIVETIVETEESKILDKLENKNEVKITNDTSEKNSDKSVPLDSYDRKESIVPIDKQKKRDELAELISKSKCTIQLVPRVEGSSNRRREERVKVSRYKNDNSNTVNIGCLSVTPVNPPQEDKTKIIGQDSDSTKKPSLFLKSSDQLLKSNSQQLTISSKQEPSYTESAIDTLKIKIPQLIESCTSKVGSNSESNKNIIQSFLMKKSHHKEKDNHEKSYIDDVMSGRYRNEVQKNDFTQLMNDFNKKKDTYDGERSVEKELAALTEKFLASSSTHHKVSNSYQEYLPSASSLISYEKYTKNYYETLEDFKREKSSLSQIDNSQFYKRDEVYPVPSSEMLDQFSPDAAYKGFGLSGFKQSDFSLFIDEGTAEKYNNFIHFMVPLSEAMSFEGISKDTIRKVVESEMYPSQLCTGQNCDQYCNQPVVYPSGPYSVPPPFPAYSPITPSLQMNPSIGHPMPLPKDNTKDSCGQLTITPLDDYGNPCGNIIPSETPCNDPFCNYPYCSSQYPPNLLPPIPPLLPADSISQQLTITPLEHSSNLPYLHRSAVNALTRRRGRPPLDPEYGATGYRRDPYLRSRYSRSDYMTRAPINFDPSLVDPRFYKPEYTSRDIGKMDKPLSGETNHLNLPVGPSVPPSVLATIAQVSSPVPQDKPVSQNKQSQSVSNGYKSEHKNDKIPTSSNDGSCKQNSFPSKQSLPQDTKESSVSITPKQSIAKASISLLISNQPNISISKQSVPLKANQSSPQTEAKQIGGNDDVAKHTLSLLVTNECNSQVIPIKSDPASKETKLLIVPKQNSYSLNPNSSASPKQINTSVSPKLTLIAPKPSVPTIAPKKLLGPKPIAPKPIQPSIENTEISSKPDKAIMFLKKSNPNISPQITSQKTTEAVKWFPESKTAPYLMVSKQVKIDSNSYETLNKSIHKNEIKSSNPRSLLKTSQNNTSNLPGGDDTHIKSKDNIVTDTSAQNLVQDASNIVNDKPKKKRRFPFLKKRRAKPGSKKLYENKEKVVKPRKVVSEKPKTPKVEINEVKHNVTSENSINTLSSSSNEASPCKESESLENDANADGIRRSGRKRKVIEGNPKFRDMERVDLKYFREERLPVKRKLDKINKSGETPVKKRIIITEKKINKNPDSKISGPSLPNVTKIEKKEIKKEENVKTEEKLQKFLDNNDIYLKPQTFV